eukprot:3940617-Prorocentrum_lima.AAC.1
MKGTSGGIKAGPRESGGCTKEEQMLAGAFASAAKRARVRGGRGVKVLGGVLRWVAGNVEAPAVVAEALGGVS